MSHLEPIEVVKKLLLDIDVWIKEYKSVEKHTEREKKAYELFLRVKKAFAHVVK